MHFCRLRKHHLDPELFHFPYGMRIPVVQEVKFLGLIFDCKSSFLPHIRYLKNKSTKALNLIRVVAHTSWGTDQDTLLLLYTSLIRSKLDYGWIVYGSARSMLDPVQNHALRLCLGAYRTSPSSSLCILANEPPLYVRCQKLSIQCCLKLSTSTHNPAYNSVFSCKFTRSFDLKPNQIPPLGIRLQPELQAVGFKKRMSCTAQSHLNHRGFLNDLRLTSACTLSAKNLPLRKYFAQNIIRYVISIKTTANSIEMDL